VIYSSFKKVAVSAAGMKKVMCFGTFDILHPGHKFFLSEAKKLGDYLVVVVARDKTVAEVKKRLPLHNENERLKQLQQLGIADKVVLGGSGRDRLAVVGSERPDIICLGYDQQSFTNKLEEQLRQRGLEVKIVRMRAYKPGIYKSSLLRKKLKR